MQSEQDEWENLMEIAEKSRKEKKRQLRLLWKHVLFKLSHVLGGVFTGMTITICLESINPFDTWWFSITWIVTGIGASLLYLYSKDIEEVIHQNQETIVELLKSLNE